MPSNTLPEISFSEDLYDDDSEGSSSSVQIESSLNEFSKRFVIEALGLEKRLSNLGPPKNLFCRGSSVSRSLSKDLKCSLGGKGT